VVVEPRDIYGSASQEARLMQLEGLAVIVKMEPPLGEDAADQTERLVLLGFPRELSTGNNPERVHYPVMPHEKLEVAAQLARVHLLEEFQVHPGSDPN